MTIIEILLHKFIELCQIYNFLASQVQTLEARNEKLLNSIQKQDDNFIKMLDLLSKSEEKNLQNQSSNF